MAGNYGSVLWVPDCGIECRVSNYHLISGINGTIPADLPHIVMSYHCHNPITRNTEEAVLFL